MPIPEGYITDEMVRNRPQKSVHLEPNEKNKKLAKEYNEITSWLNSYNALIAGVHASYPRRPKDLKENRLIALDAERQEKLRRMFELEELMGLV